jgi:CO/xanthine dehydrogenase FAD-binding subunit
VAVAIGAEVTLASARGERRVKAADLYANDGMAYLTKQPDELLVSYHLPPVNGWRASYLKLRRRGSFDFPVLGVAAWVRRADDGTVKEARIVLGAVASHPQEVPEAAAAIVGSRLEENAIAAAADAAYKPAKPMDNTDFTLAWRKEMVRVYVQRALAQLATA